MTIDASSLVAPVVTVALGMVTFYGMVSARLARIETKMDDLYDDVRKHNGVVERTGILERDMQTCFEKYDAHETRIHDLEDYHKSKP